MQLSWSVDPHYAFLTNYAELCYSSIGRKEAALPWGGEHRPPPQESEDGEGWSTSAEQVSALQPRQGGGCFSCGWARKDVHVLRQVFWR